MLREVVQRAEDDELLSGMEADFARLVGDPEQLADHRAEVAAWDATRHRACSTPALADRSARGRP
ncbi:MAG: hypothetical protein ACRDMX_06160 [Solirubrobacteraceae bacterium]